MTTNGSHPEDGNGRQPRDSPGEDAGLAPWVPPPVRRRPPAGSTRGGSGRRRRLAVGAGFVLALVWAVGLSRSVSTVRPTIDDDAFVQAANQVCAPIKRRLADVGTGNSDPTPAQRGGLIDLTVTELQGMVDGLAAIRPSSGAADEVERWLAAWEVVLGSGRRTAAALRAGDTDGADTASGDGIGPATEVNAFAGANGIGACTTKLG